MGEPKWPQYAVSLSVEHNRHKSYYETVEKALKSKTYDPDGFPDEAEIALAIVTDSVWEIQWYPTTPVGFCRVYAATFQRALELANSGDDDA